MSPVTVSAVVPVYAETDSLRALVADLTAVLGDRLSEVNIVLAADSPEDTRTVCARLDHTYPTVTVSEQQGGPGLGRAVRTGVARSTGSHILLIDSDGEMDVATAPLMVESMESASVDLVVASRWIPGGGAVGYQPFKRLLNRGFQAVFRRLFRTPLHDLTLGYKLGRAEVFQTIDLVGRFHEIACETTLRPVRAGWSVVEVPTIWTARTAGQSSNPFRRNVRYVGMALSILLTQERLVVR